MADLNDEAPEVVADDPEQQAVAPNAIAELFAQTVGGQAVADVTDYGVVVTITVPWANVSDLRTPPPSPQEIPAPQDGSQQ